MESQVQELELQVLAYLPCTRPVRAGFCYVAVVFVVFKQADEMRRRLHKLGFATFWEAYDPDPTSPDWLLAFSTSAAKTWPHDKANGPWGTIAYFDGTDVYR